MLTIFKVFIEFVTVLLLFLMFSFFDQESQGVSVQSGVKPVTPALKGRFLTPGLTQERRGQDTKNDRKNDIARGHNIN